MSNLKLPSLREITRKHFDNQDVIGLVSSEDSNSLCVKSCQKDDKSMAKISFENNGEDSSYDFDTMAERNKQNHLNNDIANLQREVSDPNIHPIQSQCKIKNISKDTDNEEEKEATFHFDPCKITLNISDNVECDSVKVVDNAGIDANKLRDIELSLSPYMKVMNKQILTGHNKIKRLAEKEDRGNKS